MGTTVTLCDDTAVSRVGTAAALRRAGHDVTETSSARELRARIARGGTDLVVLDLYLDGESGRPGVDLVEELRAEGCRVIVHSTWALDPDIHACLAVGADAFVQKGPAIEPLIDAVERVLSTEFDAPPLMTPEVAGAVRRRELFGLTPAETEVLELVADHLTTPEIARLRYVSEDTVKTQINSVRAKLGAASRAEAVRTARHHGLLGRWSRA